MLGQSWAAACKDRCLVPQTIHRRASMVLLSLRAIDHRTIATYYRTHRRTVARWVCRFEAGDLLTDRARSGRPRKFSDAARLTTIGVYCQRTPPLAGVRVWSLRDAQRYFQDHPDIVGGPMSRATIQRILSQHSLRPHRRKYYLQITDPDFFPKMQHIIDLYRQPPKHLYCFDECTCIQALKRLTPDLPATTDRPLLEDFDYRRNGTTDLIAFLRPATGAVYGQCVPNHNRHSLCRVFSDHVRTLPPDVQIHYICDNLTTHYHEDFCRTVAELSQESYPHLKTAEQRCQWLTSQDKRIVVHFIPFHASWLNMVEIWFGILKSKCLKYGHFFSVEQLCQEILAFIATWNDCYAHPFSWSYSGQGLHAKAVRRFLRLLTLETEQMDCRFLKSQLLLMSNLANRYAKLVPVDDWHRLRELAVEKVSYITNIIETDPGPIRRQAARDAHARFMASVIQRPVTLDSSAKENDSYPTEFQIAKNEHRIFETAY